MRKLGLTILIILTGFLSGSGSSDRVYQERKALWVTYYGTQGETRSCFYPEQTITW